METSRVSPTVTLSTGRRSYKIISSNDEFASPQYEGRSSYAGELHFVSRSCGDSTFSSFNDANNLGDILVPPRVEHVLNDTKPNTWSIEGQSQIYENGTMLNEHQKTHKTFTVDHTFMIGSPHIMPVFGELFWRHNCEWMEHSPGTYNEEMNKEFYASYTATILNSISK